MTPGRRRREEVLVAAGEADHLVREHRTDHQRDVVLDHGPVEPHLDRLVQPALGQLGDPVGAIVPTEANVSGPTTRG
jgi:hypothetical protein